MLFLCFLADLVPLCWLSSTNWCWKWSAPIDHESGPTEYNGMLDGKAEPESLGNSYHSQKVKLNQKEVPTVLKS